MCDSEALSGWQHPPATAPERARLLASHALEKIQEKLIDPDQSCWTIDCCSTVKFLSYRRDELMCMLHGRSSRQSYWCSSLGRFLTTADRMKLQGYTCKKQPVPDSAMNKMLGNGMSVNILERVLLQAAWAMGVGH